MCVVQDEVLFLKHGFDVVKDVMAIVCRIV